MGGAVSSPTVLVVEDNPITRKMIRFTLESDGIQVLEAEDAATALRILESPDDIAVILQDLTLPDMDGEELLARIRRLGRPRLPVLVLSGRTGRLEELRRQDLSFDAFLAKPMEPSKLLESIREHLVDGKSFPVDVARGRRVLVVDDDPSNRKLAALRLRQEGFDVVTAGGALEALELARRDVPDAILSDILMPDTDGFQLCLKVREDPGLSGIPVVLVSASYVDDEDRALARRSGAEALVARTPDYGAAIEALLAALGRVPAQPSAPVDELERRHRERVIDQLGRQLRANRALVQRSAIQAATLSVLAGISESLDRPLDPFDLSKILGEVLVHCLDATGLSTGLLYALAPGGTLELRAHCGLASDSREAAARLFDSAELLTRLALSREPSSLVSLDAPVEVARILRGLNHASALIVPLSALGQPHGALILASDSDVLSEGSWLTFSRALSAQLGQAVALGQALSNLAASELRYRSLFDGATEGIFQSTPGGRYLTANPAMARILGYDSPEELLASVDDVGRQHDVDPEARQAFLAALEESGSVFGFEARIRRRDGTLAWLSYNGRALRDERGRIAVLEGLASDITERKRAEDALREGEERYRVLFDDNPMPMWVFDIDTLRIVAANQAAAEQYGYSKAELETLTLTDLRTPEEAEKLRFAVHASPPGRQHAGVLRHLRKDGTALDVDVHWNDVSLGGRRLRLAVLHDVTERIRLEEQFRQAQKMEAVGRLAGGVAHDFNNLLTVILGYSGLLLSPTADPQKTTELASEIARAGERASSLTRQLLAFSRKQVLSPRALDLNAIVTDIESLLRRLIGDDVELVVTLGEPLSSVRADPSQLEQVIMNLAVNARDAMPKGGRLTLETRDVPPEESPAFAAGEMAGSGGRDGYVLLRIADTGTGMDDATRARIFEPFFTTKEPGKGTGLGLATVYGIVRQSGGDISVTSDLGRGTTFSIYLPRAEADERPSVPDLPGVPETPGAETILLVEDEEAVLRLATLCLEAQGYTVLQADGAGGALETVARHEGPIHLVVTNVTMPGLNGPDLVARLRSERPELPALFVSGYSEDAVALHGLLGDRSAFLEKPFRPRTLAQKVAELLAASRS